MIVTRFCRNLRRLRFAPQLFIVCSLTIPSVAATDEIGPGQASTTAAGSLDGRPVHRGYTPHTRINAAGSADPSDSQAEPAPDVAGGALTITTKTCPGGTQGAAYAGCTIAVTGGTPPYTFSVDTTSGNYPPLPEGLALNATTGAITSAQIGGQGTYMPDIIVKDSPGNQATMQITFAINGNNAFAANIFPVGSILRHRVDAATTGLPVDTSPAAAIYSGYLSSTIKPFFGDEYANFPNGIPMFEVPYNQPDLGVSTTVYQSYFTSGPIPVNAPIEGTSVSVASGGDGHVLIYQEAGNGNPPALWEMWQGIYQGATAADPWSCSSNAVWSNVNSYAMTPQGNGTTDAAGLPIAPLLLNADEVIGTGTPSAPNGLVQHPTRFTLNHTLNYWVWPATETAGVGSCTVASGSSIPVESEIAQSAATASASVPYPTTCSMGAPAGEIYRLKASVATPSCASTSPQANIIITGFRNYGIIVADNGGTGGLIGTPDARWNNNDLSCITSLTLSDFEPVNVSSLMIGTDSFETKGSSQQSQTIAFTNPGTQVVGTPLTLVASSTSGLTVSFTSETTSVCTVNGATAKFIAAGTCEIEATQAGDSAYAAAVPVTDNFTVDGEAQTITFGTLSNKTLGSGTFTVSATASSGLTVSFASTTTTTCTVSVATVTLVAAGPCTIKATQAGNASYAAATPVSQSFQVNASSVPTAPTGLTASTNPGTIAIPVTNPSFESPACPTGVCTPTGWTTINNAFTWVPTAGMFASIPDGVQIAKAGPNASFTQALTTPLKLNTTYTLTVQAGTHTGFAFGPVIQLLAGSTVLGTATGAIPPAGTWATWTLVFDSGAANAAAGEPLEISLASTVAQTSFDAVSLTATPDVVPNAPPPGNIWVMLNWTASSGATSYNVYRGTTAGGESATPIATGVTTTFYDDTEVTNGTKYFYKVAAVNAAGTSAMSAEVSATLEPPPPVAPLGLSARANTGAVAVPVTNPSFQSPACSTGACTPTGWTTINNAFTWVPTAGMFASIPDGSQIAKAGPDASFTQVLSTPLALNTTYTLTVQAGTHNTFAFGPVVQLLAGSTVLGTATGVTPPAGTWATWTLVFDSGSSNAAAGQLLEISLASTVSQTSFDAVTLTAAQDVSPGASPAGSLWLTLSWDASVGATSYNVYRGTTAGGEGATPIATGIAMAFYDDTAVTAGTKYYYKIAAVNAGGTGTMSAETSATP